MDNNSNINRSRSVYFFALICFSLLALETPTRVHAFEYQVGGPKGWSVPQKNDTGFYNLWASKNRFLIGDTLRFEYGRDSVLEVSEEDYEKCNSSHPKLFSNTGDTVVKLDRHVTFYFISGVSGHCQLGQHVIVKVVSSPSAASKSPASTVYPISVVSLFLLSFISSVVVLNISSC